MMPCPSRGWTVKTPYGENNLDEHAMLHAKNQHPEMKKMKKEEIIKMIKGAEQHPLRFEPIVFNLRMSSLWLSLHFTGKLGFESLPRRCFFTCFLGLF
jgi:hypothetical protein